MTVRVERIDQVIARLEDLEISFGSGAKMEESPKNGMVSKRAMRVIMMTCTGSGFLIFTLMLLSMYRPFISSTSRVTVYNDSGSTVDVIARAGDDLDVEFRLDNGKSKALKFVATTEGGARINVVLGDGTEVSADVGYFTPGMSGRYEAWINSDGSITSE